MSLSILVIIHELGHFIPAKLFKTKVEKFYLFFDPWFSLFKVKKGETEYGIGWLPLGGYVKISGMIDESMDKEQLEKEPETWEFRAKPTWQRLIIMVGGVTMNVILAWIIYTGLFMKYGEQYLPVENAKYGVVADSLMLNNGFKNGDKLLTLEGEKLDRFNQISKAVVLEGARTFEVERNGEKQTITLPENIQDEILNNEIKTLFTPAFPFYIDTVLKSGSAGKSGLQKGDYVVAVNNNSIADFQSFVNEVTSNKSKAISIAAKRGDTLIVAQGVNVSSLGKVGIGAMSMDNYLDLKTTTYSFTEAAPKAMYRAYEVLAVQASSLKIMFSKAGAKQMSGFGGIAKMFSPTWDWRVFWEMTGLISLLLAFFNILPIPALDGGHVVFLLYEMFTGRKPHTKVLEYAQAAGMILLLALMLYANGNDLFKALK